MASESSFDIQSKFDRQELVNAIDQTKRELSFRYDFKNSPYEIILEKEFITINAENDYKLKAIIDILVGKIVGRKLDAKILDLNSPSEKAAGNTVRKKINLIQGLTKEKAKEITKLIRDFSAKGGSASGGKKVKVSIQGEEVRVSSSSRDTLQEIISFIKSRDLELPLQFVNYR